MTMAHQLSGPQMPRQIQIEMWTPALRALVTPQRLQQPLWAALLHVGWRLGWTEDGLTRSQLAQLLTVQAAANRTDVCRRKAKSQSADHFKALALSATVHHSGERQR
jgi:hypothetical protein